MDSLPLVVDLDGTLILSDMLAESAVAELKSNPLAIFSLMGNLSSGKAILKAELAKTFDFDPAVLPYEQQVLDFIAQEKAAGRKIVLATASHITLADKIAQHLGLFDEVFATRDSVNLSAKNKRDLLVKIYGEAGFDYMGNSGDDIVVWQSARYAYVVNPHGGVLKKAQALGNVKAVMEGRKSPLKLWIKAFRLHQWVKNFLIFIPLLASHKITELPQLGAGILALIIFGLCASSVYILNDLLDVQDDRHHHKKKHRPFASGGLSLMSGFAVFPLLLTVSAVSAYLFLPLNFLIVLSIYYVLTVLYSFWLKRLMMLDAISLASLYTIRIVAGAACFRLPLTFWVLAFSMFIFLSLALVKRYTELYQARASGKTSKARGRGYYPDDLEMISSLGAASGYLSVMVLALYIQDASTINLYAHPRFIWGACPLLLFWVSRTWMLAHRGLMHDDPVVFAIKDRLSLFIGLLFGLIFWSAT